MSHNKLIGIAFLTVFINACVSGPAEIPAELTPAELIQRAQEASDRNRYKQALQYYEVVLERFPTNADLVCNAEYEIAFIHYKQNKYEAAEKEFDALLARYDTPDEELLPPQYKKLALIVLERMKTGGK
jgi:outer membrane protein assembly factor BamD (BamD/ComL family)